jgi:hypothetical protein
VLSLSFNYTTRVPDPEACGTSGSLISGGAKISRAGGGQGGQPNKRSEPACIGRAKPIQAAGAAEDR